MKYVMSDIHGDYDRFTKMLKKINFNENDILYILGDIWDRLPDGLKILDFIITHKNIILLKGNHEYAYEDFIDNKDPKVWFNAGGKETYNQIEQRGKLYMDALYIYIKNLPLYKIVDKYILVHAGLIYPKNMNNLSLEEFLSKQSIKNCLWSKNHINNEQQYKNYTVICGHTSTHDVEGKRGSSDPSIIVHRKGTIYIDCGCTFSDGRLGCLRLDDLNEFYID